ncbi:hypothetical protein OCGS_0382 [Oceaniovalibus guishaninsula JLT2003]|uniref:Uncharacterized protein n=1 Tax=Oceaniovalibus guishaninsula JLT2003 TaxID=1231392 RepID=K2HFM2_9RHOB|nr:hypothetical protein [Oceaniovalibus guishaninsula]EKE45292.1 hypothetical protein OCGS_0382 [Oceaniovalibus guishaninsula JLT2003]
MRWYGLIGTLGLAGGMTAGLLAITAPTWAGLIGWGIAMVVCLAGALWSVRKLRQVRWKKLIVEE